MKDLLNKIKKLFMGWEKHGEHARPNTFLKYVLYYPLNLLCLFGCLLFIGLFIIGGIKYQSPLLWTCILFPLIILIYNFVEEYYSFQWYRTETRKVTAKTLQNIAKYLFSAVMLYLIIRTFITG